MSDDIKIRIGAENRVRAGVDAVGNDLNQAKGKFERIGKSGGKGFAEAFGKALRGDISGAMADFHEGMRGSMAGIIGKAALWGSGIATAIFAGWKAGKALDKQFNISDKISNLMIREELKSAKEYGDQLDALRAKRKALREEQEKAAKLEKEIAGYREKNAARQEKNVVKGMSAVDRYNYLSEKVERLQGGINQPGVSAAENQKRIEELNDVNDAMNAAMEEVRKEHAASLKAEYEAEQAANAEKKARAEEQAAFRRGLIEDGLRAEIKAIEAIKAADLAAMEDRAAKAGELAAAKAAADAGVAGAMDPKGWRAAKKAGEDADRKARREDAQLGRWMDMERRGIKLPARAREALDALARAGAARREQKENEALDKAAKEAQIKMQKDVEGLKGRLDDLLTLKGG
jgi:hypothetical protein